MLMWATQVQVQFTSLPKLFKIMGRVSIWPSSFSALVQCRQTSEQEVLFFSIPADSCVWMMAVFIWVRLCLIPHGEASEIDGSQACVCGCVGVGVDYHLSQAGDHSGVWRPSVSVLEPLTLVWATTVYRRTLIRFVCVNEVDMNQCGVWMQHALAVTLTDIHQKRRKSRGKKRKRYWQTKRVMREK